MISKKELNKAIDALGLTLLQIAFIVLKLTHVIDWSWWWVLSPLWGPFVIAVVLLVVLFTIEIVKSKVNK